MDRPASIIWFERLYLGTLVIGVIQVIASWDELSRLASPVFIVGIQIFSFTLIVVLTLLVSRKRSIVAKWINLVMFVVGLPALALLFARGEIQGSVLVTIVQTLMQGVGLGLLFTASARAWLDRKRVPSSQAELRQTFD